MREGFRINRLECLGEGQDRLRGSRPVRGVCLGVLLLGLGAESSLGQSGAPASLVRVTDPRFGQGCPNAADPLGKRDSTCALRAAVAYTEGAGIPGGGFPVLYFPHGVYRVAGEGFHSALTLTKAISLQGDGAPSTVILNTSPRAATLTYLQAGDCSGKPGPCPVTIDGLTFAGQGHATEGGLIEIDSTNTGSMRHVVLVGTGGIALNLQGSSERWFFSDMEIADARWPVVLEGDTNETYFERVNVLEGGQTHDWCYSVNCPGGKRIESGMWLPDPHSAVYLDGDNVHWTDSSIKSTAEIGGVRLAPTTSSVSHTYFEGYPWGKQPRMNHAIAAPGPGELGHLTAGAGAGELEIAVDDAPWQPLYVNDPAQARLNGQHSYVNAYGIFPADYRAGSKEPSRAAPGATRGTVEIVQVGAFSGDGKAHLLSRGKAAVAWPAGSVIEQVPANGYGVLRLEENHLNSLDPQEGGPYQSGCSDTEQLRKWTSSPSKLCAEVIAGLVPDGFMVPFPTQDYVHNAFALRLVDNSVYTGGTEQDGQGWVKIPGNASVEVDAVNEPLRAFVDAGTALGTYSNGVTHVQVVQWPGGAKPASALAYVMDGSAGVRFSPQEGFYEGDVMRDGALAHQYLRSQCWYNMSVRGTAPDGRACAAAGGPDHPDPARDPARGAGGGVHATAAGGPVKYVVRDWQVNLLAPRGQAGDCKGQEVETGGVRFSTAADATLVANLAPNPGAQIAATAVVEGDGTRLAARLCNTGTEPVRWEKPPLVTLTQLP